ncbi:MAG TPA: hypothetical protein PKL84_13850, partial [Candidatus Hydrogenedentes bacterium]|nr:hypothetical protein [Candidatus Hydrogenedentota bacterium]
MALLIGLRLDRAAAEAEGEAMYAEGDAEAISKAASDMLALRMFNMRLPDAAAAQPYEYADFAEFRDEFESIGVDVAESPVQLVLEACLPDSRYGTGKALYVDAEPYTRRRVTGATPEMESTLELSLDSPGSF